MRWNTLPCIALLAGCGLERGVVTLDKDDGIPPINIDRYYRNIPPLSQTSPPDGPLTLQTDQGSYTAQLSTDATDKSRTLTFSDEVVVFDEAQSRQVSQKLSGFNIDAIEAVEVEVTSFALKDATKTPEPLIDLNGLKVLSAKLNGKELVTKADVANLQGGKTVTRRLERAEVTPFTTAVKSGKAARANVEVVVTVLSSALSSFPTQAHIIARAQPKVEVSVLRAAGL